jgi:hypothetical protein
MNFNIGIEQLLAMLLNEPLEIAQLRRAILVVDSQRNRAQPELCLHVFTRDMDVRGLTTLTAVEVKPVWPYAQHGRHGSILGDSLVLSIRKAHERLPAPLLSPCKTGL